MAFDLDFYFVKCKDQHDHREKYDPLHLGLPIFHIHNNFVQFILKKDKFDKKEKIKDKYIIIHKHYNH